MRPVRLLCRALRCDAVRCTAPLTLPWVRPPPPQISLLCLIAKLVLLVCGVVVTVTRLADKLIFKHDPPRNFIEYESCKRGARLFWMFSPCSALLL